MNRNFTRDEIEAIHIASEEGLLPYGFMGFGKICFHEVAEQLLTSMEEVERLTRILAVNTKAAR